MAGFSSVTGLESVVFADNASFDGTERGGIMTTDGQFWIGATASPHVKLGTLTSPDGSITIGYSSPNVTLQVTGGAPYYSLTPYIVGTDTHSQYSTIAAAITQAIADGASASNPKNIHIKPKGSAYAENLTVVDGINLIGQGYQTVINGKISMTTAGSATISNLVLETNADFLLDVTGSAASGLAVRDCFLNCTDNTGISFTSSSGSSSIQLDDCLGDIGTTGIALFVHTGAGALSCNNLRLGNSGGSSTASTTSTGSVNLYYSLLPIPFATTGTGTFNIEFCEIITVSTNTTCLTTAGTGESKSLYSSYDSGTASSISIGAGTTVNLRSATILSSNANVLTGAGTLNYAFVTFVGSSSGHNVSSETPYATLI